MNWDLIKWLSVLTIAAVGQLCSTAWFASELNTRTKSNQEEIEELRDKDQFNSNSLIITSTKLALYEKKLDKMSDKLDKIYDKIK